MFINFLNFNIKQIAESGQCFRLNQIDINKFSLIAYGEYLEITQSNTNEIELSCSMEAYEKIWKDYFDTDYDYSGIIDTIEKGDDIFLRNCAAFGSGIRIVRQEPFEAAISFIISQNKNIPAIKGCIEALCKVYGERKICTDCNNTIYYTFPSAEALAHASSADLRALKTGYRDQYIISAAKAVVEGSLLFDELKIMKSEIALTKLKSIHGIGEKVANCILLYGLHHIEVFPVDVWIKKILKEIYEDRFDLLKYYGYAGIVQQYMFYYMRYGYHSHPTL
ncbi:MAG: DNA-3-methyladenine glycosylase 2 family protein [Clostridiales bacterium]|nr:DNA-3-methyladenine glycosylase 2 family protein [Clostridiales bacterium]